MEEQLKAVQCMQDYIETHIEETITLADLAKVCLLYTSPSPRDRSLSRMPSSA